MITPNNSLPRRIGFVEPSKSRIPKVEFHLVSNFTFMGGPNPKVKAATLQILVEKTKKLRECQGNYENAYHVRQVDGFAEPVVMPLPQVMKAFGDAKTNNTDLPKRLEDIS